MAASAAVCWDLEDRGYETSDCRLEVKRWAMIFCVFRCFSAPGHLVYIRLRSVPGRTHVVMHVLWYVPLVLEFWSRECLEIGRAIGRRGDASVDSRFPVLDMKVWLDVQKRRLQN